MGQMLRGGRSWPSERKLAAGAEKSGNELAVNSGAIGSVGGEIAIGVAEQNAEQHTLHLSATPCGCAPWW
jgi:hypothetical protein